MFGPIGRNCIDEERRPCFCGSSGDHFWKEGRTGCGDTKCPLWEKSMELVV